MVSSRTRLRGTGISRTFQITRDLQELTVLENMIVQSQVKGFWDMFGTSMLKEKKIGRWSCCPSWGLIIWQMKNPRTCLMARKNYWNLHLF